MRILTIRRVLGLALIGVAYVHGKRGGDASIESISDTLRYVSSTIANRLGIEPRSEPKPMHRTPERNGMSARANVPNGMVSERTPRPQRS